MKIKTVPFQLGRIVFTHGVSDLMDSDSRFANFLQTCIGRHKNCDWGIISDENWDKNDDAVSHGGGLISNYIYRDTSGDGKDRTMSIITEADRSATIVGFEEGF